MSRAPEAARDDRTAHHGAAAQDLALHRVTVNLIPRAARALEQAAQLTGDTMTDTVNRALQIYAYLEQVTHDGGAIYIRETPGSELQPVKIL